MLQFIATAISTVIIGPEDLMNMLWSEYVRVTSAKLPWLAMHLE